jgi:hypothetical protein
MPTLTSDTGDLTFAEAKDCLDVTAAGQAKKNDLITLNMSKAFKICMKSMPETADFPIQDPAVFASTFKTHLLHLQETLEDPKSNVLRLDDLQIGFEEDGEVWTETSLHVFTICQIRLHLKRARMKYY